MKKKIEVTLEQRKDFGWAAHEVQVSGGASRSSTRNNRFS